MARRRQVRIFNPKNEVSESSINIQTICNSATTAAAATSAAAATPTSTAAAATATTATLQLLRLLYYYSQLPEPLQLAPGQKLLQQKLHPEPHTAAAFSTAAATYMTRPPEKHLSSPLLPAPTTYSATLQTTASALQLFATPPHTPACSWLK